MFRYDYRRYIVAARSVYISMFIFIDAITPATHLFIYFRYLRFIIT